MDELKTRIYQAHLQNLMKRSNVNRIDPKRIAFENSMGVKEKFNFRPKIGRGSYCEVFGATMTKRYMDKQLAFDKLNKPDQTGE